MTAFCEPLERRRLLAAAYHLTYDDEFNSLQLSTYNASGNLVNTSSADSGYLTNDAYDSLGYNGSTGTELEAYSNPAVDAYNPFSVSNGILSITAEPTPASMVGTGTGKTEAPYVSGMLSTGQGQSYTPFNQSDGFSQEYGYFEIRAEVPQGAGMWPAFWMVPEPHLNTTNTAAEYDIFEIPVNPNGYEPQNTQTIYQVEHAGSALQQNAYTLPAGQDASTAFHTYGFEWTPTQIMWYVDGQLTAETSNVSNTPMYMLMNLAVGGSWPGSPSSSSEFPASLKIDYVRVYSDDSSVAQVTPQTGYSVSSATLAAISIGTPAPTVPGTPTLASAPTQNAVAITWAASTDSVGISDYIVFRNGQQIGTSASNTYNDSGLSPSTTYSYTVEAVDTAGNDSALSGALSVTTSGSGYTQLTGTASASTTASYGNSGNTYANAFDGNTATFFDSPNSDGNWIQLDLGSAKSISQIAFAPRVGFEFRMDGGVFEASNDPSFATGVTTLYTVSAQPVDGLSYEPISGGGSYRYIRYVAPAGSYGNIAEMEAFGGTAGSSPVTGGGTVQLVGTASANTTASYGNSGDTYANVFDGNTSTFFDAPSASGNWVQLNLGSPQTISQIAYAPRAGFEYRMVGGYFEASNDPTFGTGVVTLYTVTSAPVDGLTTQAISAGGTYQYVRYVAPAGSYGNIAEMQVFGPSSVTTTPSSQLTGTASANTTASYANDGDTYANVFDGNTNTFFDAPTASGNYVQLDLGAAHTITSIAYAPRVGFEYRMVGGYFEASNDPTFSTGVTVLDTINSTPSDGLTSISLSVAGTYRYIRYVAPANSYGNIAEMQVFGY